MIILGVDPGTLFTGYAVIKSNKNLPDIISCDVIRMKSTDGLPDRLKKIYESLMSVIKKHNPDEVAVETAFYSKNIQSTLKLGYARSVAILSAANNNLPVNEYSPREVKKSVVGYGNASKEQVKFMVNKMFKLKLKKSSYDLTDAIAIAVCHFNKLHTFGKTSGTWDDFLKDNKHRVKFTL
jgi:crossover junction endodeoxyribonuclease RuvC